MPLARSVVAAAMAILDRAVREDGAVLAVEGPNADGLYTARLTLPAYGVGAVEDHYEAALVRLSMWLCYRRQAAQD